MDSISHHTICERCFIIVSSIDAGPPSLLSLPQVAQCTVSTLINRTRYLATFLCDSLRALLCMFVSYGKAVAIGGSVAGEVAQIAFSPLLRSLDVPPTP